MNFPKTIVGLCNTPYTIPYHCWSFDDMAANCMLPTYDNCSVNLSAAGSPLLIDANPDVSGIGV